MKRLEKTFKAFANRRRLAIITLLKKCKELTVSEIAEKIKLSFKATSKHLNLLANSDVLEKEQRSLEMFYRLNPEADSTIHHLVKAVSNSRE
ncbi:ArsR family transcriptional regulator [Patescibacteria group bacterium]|nr:MAG: ArsR family transcriptional regulator [Patescibacteria group bacterium]